MKNYLWILSLLVIVFVVSGCGSTTGGSGKTYIGGTEGINAEFLPSNPPDTIIDGGSTPFSIILKLDNVGESTILSHEGYIQIQGLDTRTYTTTTFKKNFGMDLNAAKKNFDGSVLNGQTGTVEFGPLTYKPTIQGDTPQNVWADVCYKYTTMTSAPICIKKDSQSSEDDKVCVVDGEKNPENSGGPIQITSIKESSSGTGKIQLSITLTHSGKGDAFFKDTDMNGIGCEDKETNGNRGKVHIKFKPILGGSVYPQCSGLSDSGMGSEGYLRMYKDGSGKETAMLSCIIDISSANTIVQEPLQMETTYLYLQHVSKEINIRHVAR